MMYPLYLVLPKRILNPEQMTSTYQFELEATPNLVLHFRPFIGTVWQPSFKSKGWTGEHYSQLLFNVACLLPAETE
jgi:hypothetical protein